MSSKTRSTNEEEQLPLFSYPDIMVIFLIGPNDKVFHVHAEIAHKCHVFRAAFSNDFEEGLTQTYTIKDASEGAFRFLMQWTYQDKTGHATPAQRKIRRILGPPTRCTTHDNGTQSHGRGEVESGGDLGVGR